MSTSFKKLSVRGHRIKVKVLDVGEKFGGSVIYKPDTVLEQDRSAVQEAIVLEVGHQAFQIYGDGDQKGVPWCKVGDHVLMTRYEAMKQADCTDEEDSKIRVTLDENIIGVFENDD